MNLLKQLLPPAAHVGTVDKFQGQEAAVVIVSMTTSKGVEAPHGTEFLFNPNRLNVAVSRAQCLSLVAPIVDTADAAFVVSLDCQFLAWGSRAQQLFGFSPSDVLGRYCYDVMPARDASGQCLCGVNCPMVTAARYGYSAPPSEARICTKQNCSIWVRTSPIVLRAPRGGIGAILVLASDISRYKLTEQLVCWIAGRLDGSRQILDIRDGGRRPTP